MCNHELNIIRVKFHFSYESLSNRWRCGEIAVCVKGQRTRYFSTGRGGFILVSDYLLMQVTLVGSSWDVVAGDQTGVRFTGYETNFGSLTGLYRIYRPTPLECGSGLSQV